MRVLETMMFQASEPLCREWESPTRYYRLEIAQDMFGMWVITRLWKGRFSKKGSKLTISTDDKDAALQWLDKIGKQRAKKGYTLLTA